MDIFDLNKPFDASALQGESGGAADGSAGDEKKGSDTFSGANLVADTVSRSIAREAAGPRRYVVIG